MTMKNVAILFYIKVLFKKNFLSKKPKSWLNYFFVLPAEALVCRDRRRPVERFAHERAPRCNFSETTCQIALSCSSPSTIYRDRLDWPRDTRVKVGTILNNYFK